MLEVGKSRILQTILLILIIMFALHSNGMAQGLYDVTSPGNVVVGVPDDGDWPGAEHPALAIDDNVNTKYLHFKGDFNPDVGPTGIRVTPSIGPTIVTGLTFSTANDFPGRDPVSFELYGSNGTIDGPYTLISSGDILDFQGASAWPRLMKNSTPITFPNDVDYKHYQLLFTAIRGPAGGAINSMQIAEVEMLGSKSVSLKATGPQPTDGAVCTNNWVYLSWIPGRLAVSHNVYFSADLDYVTQRKASVLIATTEVPYTLVGDLQMGTTYYWCVDEVNDAEPDSPWRGEIWNFRIPDEPAVYLLITNEQLAEAFEPLVQRRTKQGFPGRLLTVENICATYTGGDVPRKIRNCIMDHYIRYGTQYVTLGGDQTIVPVRYCVPHSNGYEWPTDLYYADMDGGNWDENGNRVYGEMSEVTESALIPEVHLGRIPLPTSEDATAYINKVVTYETVSPDGFANSMIFFGRWGISTGDSRRNHYKHHDPTAGAEFRQTFTYYTSIQPYWQAVPLHFLWETYSSWDTEICGDYDLTRDHLIEQLNKGYHFSFNWSHGGPTAWGVTGGRRFQNKHAAALTNAIPGIVFSYACSSAHFDDERMSLSEAFVQNPHGGAIAYFGHTRAAFGGFADCDQLFPAMAQGKDRTTGEIITGVLTTLAALRMSDPAHQYNFTLHGDSCIQLLAEESGRNLQLFQPKGCEVIERGSDFYIRWNAAGIGFATDESIKLEYSSDSGQTWHTIPGAHSLPYNGRIFLWRHCPLPAGSQYRIRVVSLSDPSITDMSGRDFTIGDLAILTVKSSPTTDYKFYLSGSKTDLFSEPPDFNITILKGESVSVLAPAVAGKSSELAFVRWKDESGNTMAATTDYSFIITEDKTIVAEYNGP